MAGMPRGATGPKETTLQPTVCTPLPRLREARRHLLDAGDVPDGLVHPLLRQRWLRSPRFGLEPVGRTPGRTPRRRSSHGRWSTAANSSRTRGR
jgi:hypothetical protein